MEIFTRHYNDVAILSLMGRLDAETAVQFSHTIGEQMAAGYNRLVIDLKKVECLSSAGITACVQGVMEARRQGGDFRIANARAQVKVLLTQAGVDSAIKLYPNVVGATVSYFPGANKSNTENKQNFPTCKAFQFARNQVSGVS